MQDLLQDSAKEALEFWATPNCPSGSTFRSSSTIHSECSVLVLADNGSYESHVGDSALSFRLPKHHDDNDDRPKHVHNNIIISSANILDWGDRSAASVHAKVGKIWSSWMVFLLHGSTHWKCISAAFSSAPALHITPDDFFQVTTMTQAYCNANRACDGQAMAANAFHKTSRLTYSFNGSIQIKDCAAFCSMVTDRYNDPNSQHTSYRALHVMPNSKELLGKHDTLLSVDFCSSNVAMVILRVGHPPFLWADLLTCARIKEEEDDDDTKKKWWIVHKSSCSEPFHLEIS